MEFMLKWRWLLSAAFVVGVIGVIGVINWILDRRFMAARAGTGVGGSNL